MQFSTSAFAASVYLRSVVFVGAQQSLTTAADHAPKLFKFVNAPWPQDHLYSYVGCHLLILQGFISPLLPQLSSEEALSAPRTWRCVILDVRRCLFCGSTFGKSILGGRGLALCDVL